MILKVELPDWALKGQRISVFAGTELVAFQEPGKPLMLKVGRCSKCGLCCLDCSDLVKEVGDNDRYKCGRQMDIPFVCCLTPLEDPASDNCTVRFKAI